MQQKVLVNTTYCKIYSIIYEAYQKVPELNQLTPSYEHGERICIFYLSFNGTSGCS